MDKCEKGNKAKNDSHFDDGLIESVECKTLEGRKCIFPFKYRGKTHTTCMYDCGFHATWCAVKLRDEKSLAVEEWGNCDYHCPTYFTRGHINPHYLDFQLNYYFIQVQSGMGSVRLGVAQNAYSPSCIRERTTIAVWPMDSRIGAQLKLTRV